MHRWILLFVVLVIPAAPTVAADVKFSGDSGAGSPGGSLGHCLFGRRK
jgi:hypothetical protein